MPPRAPASDPSSDLLDRAAVAARLGKTIKQISNMQHRNQIPSPINIPGIGVRWSAQAIDAWLDAHIRALAVPVSPPHYAAPVTRPQATPAARPLRTLADMLRDEVRR